MGRVQILSPAQRLAKSQKNAARREAKKAQLSEADKVKLAADAAAKQKKYRVKRAKSMITTMEVDDDSEHAYVIGGSGPGPSDSDIDDIPQDGPAVGPSEPTVEESAMLKMFEACRIYLEREYEAALSEKWLTIPYIVIYQPGLGRFRCPTQRILSPEDDIHCWGRVQLWDVRGLNVVISGRLSINAKIQAPTWSKNFGEED